MARVMARGTVVRVARAPRRIPAALRSMFAMAPNGWWKKPPFLPLPDREYWHFRLETANGGDGTTPPNPDEVVDVIDWSRRMRRRAR